MTETPAVPTCVVAEDDPAVREFITRVLVRERFTVFGAGNGREAADFIAAHHCDLLVTDLAMPERDGIETIAAARKQYPHLKILVISGKFDANMLRVAKTLGADASLAKPFSADELMAAVRALVYSVS
jgi:DNA-binding response OmpR family regulator